jgi:hypothetical protein
MGDSRSNECKAFSVLATWESFALVPHSTSGVETRLGSVDEELHEGILFTDQDSGLCNKIDTFVQFPTETIEEVLEHFNEYMRAKFLEWHTSLLMRRMKMEMVR